MNRTVKLKAEQIARLVVAGCPLTRVAIEMGMSYDGLLRITKTPVKGPATQELFDQGKFLER